MTVVNNARGVPLSYSAASVNHYSATDAGSYLYGTNGNDSFWGDDKVSVTMTGGLGDDIHHLYSKINRAQEAPGEGIDTVKTWMDYRLPANIENLVVTDDGRHAFGNAMDNIITGGSGQQTLDGGPGDDVLQGGAGADIFAVAKGNGSDLIVDLGANDSVRLTGYGITSFEEVTARATQAGSDLRVNLGDGEILVLANTTVDQLTKDQFQLQLDKSRMELTFSDDFNSLDLWDGQSGTWESNYWWGDPNGTTLADNNELQWYIDTDYGPTQSANPFSVDNGILTITASQTPEAIKSHTNGYDYTSGMLTSFQSSAQTYGYYEMRADMPDTQGAWPAFWLIPADGSWPPELDVIELVGQNPNRLVMTAHSNETGSHTQDRNIAQVADTDGFHTYGVRWAPEKITWYYDGVEVAQTETPSDMHDPMYMIVNLAVGGMAGAPTNNPTDPAEMQIDYIRAYALDGAPVTNAGDDVIAGTAAADSLHGGDGKDVLEGKAGDDRLYGEAGNDTLIGNGGVDYFGGGGGNDTVDYHSASSGWAIDLGAGSARQGGTTETLVSIENAAGGAGDDTLVGDPEANALRGRAGDDVLDGGRGDDSLFGGTGADTFHFDNMSVGGGDGNDKIFGFEEASDVLSFSDLIDSDADGDADLADLLNAVSSVNDRGAGSDVVVTFDNASSVTFTGAGTGGTDSLTELVDDATTQIQVS